MKHDAVLLDKLKECFGFQTDVAVAAFCGITKESVSLVRRGAAGVLKGRWCGTSVPKTCARGGCNGLIILDSQHGLNTKRVVKVFVDPTRKCKPSPDAANICGVYGRV